MATDGADDSSPAEAEGGIRRPDVSARLRQRKTLVEQCVKSSLSSRLAPSWDVPLRDILVDNIERQIRSTSEITVRGSLLVNEVLLHCLRLGRPLPPLNPSFFNACFLQGLKKESARESKTDFSIARDVYENEFHDYPTIQRNRGDIQAITIAASRYGTNLKTSVVYAFLGRQKSFIATWIAYQKDQRAEESQRREEEMRKELEKMRKRLRQLFPGRDPEANALEYKMRRVEEAVQREREGRKKMLSQWKEVSAFGVQCAINGWKGGTLLHRDTGKRKRGSVTPQQEPAVPPEVNEFIAKERALLGNPKDLQITDKTSVAMLLCYLFHILEFYREQGVGRGFSLAPICKIKRHFMTIDTTVLHELLKNVATEAGSACPEWLATFRRVSRADLFQDPAFVDTMWRTTFDLDGLRRRRTFGRQIDTDGVAMVAHFQVTLRQRGKHAKRLRQRHTVRQSSARVIAIDPGRSNLVTAFDSATSRITTLTRREYYQRAGITKANAKVANWELPLQGITASLAKTSIRTSSSRLAYEYRQVLVRNYDRLWELRTERKRAKAALTVYAGKQHALDGFFAGLKAGANDRRPVVVAYGAATFHPTGKGEVSVPVKRVLRVCQRHFPTTLVNEHLTTKVHHACHHRLNPVSRVSERAAIRGLCWCPTCSKFVSRDGNAARNILRVYRSMALGAPRPHDLRFGQPRQNMQVLPRVAG